MKIDINNDLPKNDIVPLKSQGSEQSGFFKKLLGQILFEKKTSNLTADKAEGSVNKRNIISLGRVNSDNPTVSNLLIKHPELGKNCWDIVYNQVNQSKPFTKIPDGSEIFFDPENSEIVWGEMVTPGKYQVDGYENDNNQDKSFNTLQPETLSEKLVNAVETYIGKEYSDVDCYELVVDGLEKLGVNYRGKGGLSQHLAGLAKGKGLPVNAYMTGEGLVEASGTILYSRVFSKVNNPDRQTMAVVAELEQKLEKGAVLSFSTQSRGHTGIVSKKAEGWTYINSGRQDHNIDGGIKRKGVGEEFLTQEIRNWFRLANKHNEELLITVGRFDENKLVMFQNNKQGISVRA